MIGSLYDEKTTFINTMGTIDKFQHPGQVVPHLFSSYQKIYPNPKGCVNKKNRGNIQGEDKNKISNIFTVVDLLKTII